VKTKPHKTAEKKPLLPAINLSDKEKAVENRCSIPSLRFSEYKNNKRKAGEKTKS
jgi:hypothetical protein